MTDVQGSFRLRTVSRSSCLIPSPLWYHSGDLLTVEYRTDPARVADLLPAPLREPSADNGEVELRPCDPPTEDLAQLELREIIGGSHRRVGVIRDGGRSLARLSKDT